MRVAANDRHDVLISECSGVQIEVRRDEGAIHSLLFLNEAFTQAIELQQFRVTHFTADIIPLGSENHETRCRMTRLKKARRSPNFHRTPIQHPFIDFERK